MKRSLCICAAVCVAMNAAACFGAEENASIEETTPAAEPKATEPVTQDSTQTYYKGNRLPHARIRFELTPLWGFDSGKRDRIGDFAIRSNVDYEIPIVDHLTIAPRVIPLMFYDQDNDDDMWIIGAGVVFRGYSNGKEQRGFFGEIGLHLLAQSAKFPDNTGTFNFMEEVGVGYMFRSGWHIAGKLNHISNAGFADKNAGVNNAGFGLGYSFKRRR